MRKLLIYIALLAIAMPASAQFYTDGIDPGWLKWYSMDTQNYRFIYPEGLDSLARVYGRYMEQYRPLVGVSTGYTPGSKYRAKTPVVLHAWTDNANGSVTWAPKRMEFNTLPDVFNPWPMPWEKSLVIHESRHLSQMQPGYDRWFKPLYWLIGEMGPGAFSGLYPSLHLLEGDAVVAETALSRTGRGRTASFLGYYMSAFDEGDWRDWWKWRYGSFKKYAPNHYALGYMTVAGARAFYNDPLFMDRYFQSATRHPFRLAHLRKTLRQDTGLVTLRQSGRKIMEKFHQLWLEDASRRAPFIMSRQITPQGKWYTEYSGGVSDGENIYIKKVGKAEAYSLVKIDSLGNEEYICSFASGTSALSWDGKSKLYWSEPVSDIRWEKAGTSRIRYLDLSDGKKKNLTTRGRYFHPNVSPDGTKVAAVELPVEGRSYVAVLSAEDGSLLERTQAPDSLQFVQAVWTSDESLAVSTVSEGGASIYTIKDGFLENLLPPQPVNIGRMICHNGTILFQSDWDGSDEIYFIYPKDLKPYPATSVLYGACDPFFVGENLMFTSHTTAGRLLYCSLTEHYDLIDWSEPYTYEVADILSAQEKALSASVPRVDPDTVSFSQPKRYRKLPHIFNIHSWVVPFYVETDALSQLSYDITDYVGGLGATAIFQNVLGTSSGYLGYSWGRAPEGGFRHAGHLKLTYTGLFPAFELTANVGQSAAMQYTRRRFYAEDFELREVNGFYRDATGFDARLRTYVPLNLSSGGWSRGLVPSLTYLISNNLYDKGEVNFTIDDTFGSASKARFTGYTEGLNVPMQMLAVALNGYSVLNMGSSQEYPRWGGGGEIGWRGRLGMTELYPSAFYAYGYCYLPGFTRVQGWKLSATYQHIFDKNSVFTEYTVNTSPRGFGDVSAALYMMAGPGLSTNQIKLSADYAIPIYVGDISWFSPVAYITHFMLKPHTDITFFPQDGALDGNLASSGFSLVAKLANFFWMPYKTELGFSVDINYGKSFDRMLEQGIIQPQHRWYWGFVYNMPF